MLRLIKKIIPRSVFRSLQPYYHFALALLAALVYRFPSRHIKVVAITGTKGKTSTAEMVNAILEEAGLKTALAGTLRFKIGNDSRPNLYKMTIPGRFFVQSFLRKAVKAGCDWVVLEMTSEGAKQFRHKFIQYDALIFTNLAPEHIESHGSYENYLAAKLSIAEEVACSKKPNRSIIANTDDAEGHKFLSVNVPRKLPYSLKDAEPYFATDNGTEFAWRGERIKSPLPGVFNILNMVGAATFAEAYGISAKTIARAIGKLGKIRGRMEKIDEGQNFTVYVDYAHTPDSLKAAYEAVHGSQKICILGNTGGGRDTWKRKVMGEIADKYCSHIILTNEDPYDEDPQKIVNEMAKGIISTKFEIIMDRREAIRHAISIAEPKGNIIITGKGTDPYIMEANGKKTPWDDATVVREELRKVAMRSE